MVRLTAVSIRKSLCALADETVAVHSARFFKTGKGEYGEGDKFLGIRVPVLRREVRHYRDAPEAALLALLRSAFHEERLFEDNQRDVLYKLAASPTVWDRRMAMMATYHFIRQGDFRDALQIARAMLADDHDLIHKVVGWMLRETGKRDMPTLEQFLTANHRNMPRTCLRYAIEKFPPARRKAFLDGTV